jgi:putative FmdB family regulatory protein
MPIYEFYCVDCHRIYSFFSRKIDTTTRPSCPRCRRPKLERRVSQFAISRKRTDGGGPAGDLPGLDDAKMEQAMESLIRETEGLDENDPRQLARMMRKLHQTAGMPLDEKTEQAIRRLESGESPEKIEEEMGEVFGEDAPAPVEPTGQLRRLVKKRPPEVDETLYDL